MKFAKNPYKRSQIVRECDQEGQSIEEMVRQAVANNQPIEAHAPMVYTEEADGVQPQYDPRTDKYEVALDAIDKYQKSQVAKSQESAPQENNKSDQAAEQNAE